MADAVVCGALIAWAQDKLGEAQSLVALAAVVGGMVIILSTAIRVRGALIPILGTVVVAGVVAWAVANVDWIATQVGDETGGANHAGVVVEPGP